jgi:hypothetical protein
MNMLLVTKVVEVAVYRRNAPIRRALASLGSDPYSSGMLRIAG